MKRLLALLMAIILFASAVSLAEDWFFYLAAGEWDEVGVFTGGYSYARAGDTYYIVDERGKVTAAEFKDGIVRSWDDSASVDLNQQRSLTPQSDLERVEYDGKTWYLKDGMVLIGELEAGTKFNEGYGAIKKDGTWYIVQEEEILRLSPYPMPTPVSPSEPAVATKEYVVGETVTYGEGLTWRVLKVENGNALLWCENFVAEMPYSAGGSISWPSSDVRKYLNGSEFLNNTFTVEEQDAILTTTIDTTGEDRLFLLSADEIEAYKADDYAEMDGTTYRWLRMSTEMKDQSAKTQKVYTLSSDGRVQTDKVKLSDACGVQPAMWVTAGQTIPRLSRDAEIGDTVLYGEYEGEAIRWIVLEREEDQVLLLSRDGLDIRPYNENGGPTDWETCSLRDELNSYFYGKAFDREEQKTLMEMEYGGITDKVRLLYREEVERYYPEGSPKLELQPASYMKENMDDSYIYWWWLSDTTEDGNKALAVTDKGDVLRNGVEVDSMYQAVRPVIRVDISGLT